MSNAVQSSALAWLLSSITSATVKALLTDTDYVYSSAHDFLDDVPSGARVSTLTASVSASGNALTVADLSFGAVSNPQDIQGVWLYIDAATDATRRLIAWWDRRSDSTLFRFTPDAGTVTVKWSGPAFTI